MRLAIWWAAGAIALALFAGSQATAQGLLPWERTYDIFVADTTLDSIYRFANLNQDLDFNDTGESLHVYDDYAATGPDIGNPTSVALDTAGRLYVSDTSIDQILVLIDRNGDGNAYNVGQGEWATYIDNSNASGVQLNSIMEIRMDVNNIMWCTHSSTSTYPLDGIIRAEDLNLDGDCQDAGEIVIAYDSLHPNAPYQLGVPFALAIDPVFGYVYVSDVNPDFIYRAIDGNMDGDLYDAGEMIVVYSGTAPSPAFSNAATLAFGPNGDLYMADSTGDTIIVMRDKNSDGDFEDAGEAWVFASQATNSLGLPYFMQGIEVDEYGRVFGTESGSSTAGVPDGITMFQDLNNDGDADDPGETVYVYDSTLGSTALSNPKEIALIPTPRLSSPNATVKVGQNLILDFEAVDGDTYQLLLGLVSLGYDHPLPPYGYLTHVPLVIAPSLALNADGKAQWVAPVPATLPAPFTLYMTMAAGKLPYRYYLSNGLTVNIIP